MTATDILPEIKRIGSAWRAAFARRDIDALMGFYSPDTVTFDIAPPRKIMGLPANRENWARFFSAFDGDLGIETLDADIFFSGDVVIVHELAHIRGTREGHPVALGTRSTIVLHRSDGRWRIVHSHSSLPFDGETPEAPAPVTG